MQRTTQFASGWGEVSMKADYIAENALIAILSVNHWTADRVFPLVE